MDAAAPAPPKIGLCPALCVACTTLLMLLAGLFLVGIVVAMIVGMALDWNTVAKCPGSNLNEYAVVVVVLTGMVLCCFTPLPRFSASRERHALDIFLKPRIGCAAVVYVGVHTWGFVELYNRACIYTGLLWTVLAVNAWANAAVTLVYIVMWVVLVTAVAAAGEVQRPAPRLPPPPPQPVPVSV
jgi:hypothetical protein